MSMFTMKVCFILFSLFGAARIESQEHDFVRANQCRLVYSTTITDGFVPFTSYGFACNGSINPSTYTNVTCGARCQDPRTKLQLSGAYRTEAITINKMFQIRTGERVFKHITLGCRCVARRQRKINSRRKNSHRQQGERN